MIGQRLRTLVGSKKRLAKLAIFGAIAVCGILALALGTQLYAQITSSEATNDIFNAAATPPPELLESVVWQPDPPDLKRAMEPLTRVDVTSAWIRAWEQMSIVAKTGDTTGLEVYFANSALEALLASVPDTRDFPAHQLGHELRVDFYSQDGQVIGLTADRVQLLRSATIGDALGWMETEESYEAVLLLEDGNWRIQHWVRTSFEQRWWTDPIEAATGPGPDGGFQMNGINYYPQATPFDAFWPNYDPDVVASDLDRVVAAGLDSVRIFLPFDGLDGRWTDAEDLAPVIDFLDRSRKRDLGVVVTLFDGRTDHRTEKWNSDTKHLETVVALLADHPALVMWDLKNEPDRDIGANGVGEQLLYAWLGHVGHAVRAIDPVTPVTIGWSTPEAALAAPIQTDVVSFHFYAPAEELETRAEELIAHAGSKPVVLTEYGLPTWDSLFPGGHTEAQQARYLADVLEISADSGIEGTMAWTLWDLAAAPADAGRMPWRTGPQRTMGLLRADGSPKPSLAVVRPGADLASVPGISPFSRLGLTFWRMVAAFLVLSMLFRVLRNKHRARKIRLRS